MNTELFDEEGYCSECKAHFFEHDDIDKERCGVLHNTGRRGLTAELGAPTQEELYVE